jgi:hypothetical protein
LSSHLPFTSSTHLFLFCFRLNALFAVNSFLFLLVFGL